MNDYFEFDERKLEARGKTSGKVYRIGEKIQVKVANVDTILRRVDFALMDPLDGGRRRPKEGKVTKKDAGKDIRRGEGKAGAASRENPKNPHIQKKRNNTQRNNSKEQQPW
jgi:ribonuclease R